MELGAASPIQVLYRDDAVLIAVKPQGLLSQPDGSPAPDMLSRLAAGEGLYPVHRLDRATGGVMVFARTRTAAAALSAQFAAPVRMTIEKTYLAVVGGRIEVPFTRLDFLTRDPRLGIARVTDAARGGKEARLSARPIAVDSYAGQDVTLLAVTPETGRFHQIRCQLAASGHPILGDGKYGSRVKCPLALFAERLAFRHPVTQVVMTFHAAPPCLPPWSLFAEELAVRA